ncbi:Ldh family oxidoreductase [Jannaschia seohaensis]|uniref:(2R)-3-sulfolactate dehydrogenase (NADP+) n=1 Tax=Jannaschia seohaensis TaxID=475081 RepID=A0A2Y9AJ45_9RHOB|nr:Ldh family oxidoreductase [Jannaschia seohaensis]PWJ20427.1 (2R)-3-sulfolactate dehydrogenase (NADP+) [Jannaschia seohaensis]SSA44511.1 (2R)-3-sulfolactate dehydrogenase (NADP+) [Jannaschia seohaensis]
MPVLTLTEIEDLAFDALTAAGTTAANARPLAKATAETEAEGIASHGLAYIPVYCEHVRCGKVDGAAVPVVEMAAPGMVRVDAATGFAHPAIAAGFPSLIDAARTNGIAALAIRESYNCGVLGLHTRRLAEAGLTALGFTNAPASIAPSGGRTPVVGTNPISLAVPDGAGGTALLIDQSASAIAKSEVMKHAREGKPIPEGWALDPEGRPTTDPELGLKGSMAPAGGYKGVGLALIVETMAAAMTGAVLGRDASPFSGPVGGPPRTGQFFLAIDPEASGGAAARTQIDALVGAVRAAPGARLPGDGRRTKRDAALRHGVEVAQATLDRIAAL